MKLSKEEASLFYKLNDSLLFYTNQKYPVIKGFNSPVLKDKGYPPEKIAELNKRLYDHPELIDSFIAENPFKFNQEELNVLKGWRKFIKGEFFIMSHSKEYSVFFEAYKDEPKVYGVVGLCDEIKNVVGNDLPVLVKTVLLPFKGKIVYCGVFNFYNICFGWNILREIKRDYQEAKVKYGIIISLDSPIVEKGKEELLKYYLRNENNRIEYADEINQILRDNPSLLKIYYQEIGKSNTRRISKKLSKLGVASKLYLVIFEDVVIASGKTKEEVKKQIENILPEEKRDFIYLFKYKGPK